jgi:Xaa-Pro dipeptidase
VTFPLERFRDWLDRSRVAAAVVTDPVSIAYLTGFRADTAERLMALALSDDSATLIVPALEVENASSRVREIEVVGWKDGQDPWRALAGALGSPDRIGVEKGHLTLAAADRLRAFVDSAELVEVGEEVRRLRLIKTPAEIEALAQAALATDRVTARVLESLRPGQSELEAAASIAQITSEEGALLSFPPLVQSGPNSALPHLMPSERRLQRGDLVLLDFGAAIDGYKGDTTRMAVVGAPAPRELDLHRLVLEAHDASIAVVRPGVTTGDVDAAARAVLVKAGLGDRFIHRVGHGLGLQVHEDPSLDPGSHTVLEDGMAFTIEPGVYIPGWGGIRIEDDLVVTGEGARVLTAAPRELFAVSAT